MTPTTPPITTLRGHRYVLAEMQRRLEALAGALSLPDALWAALNHALLPEVFSLDPALATADRPPIDGGPKPYQLPATQPPGPSAFPAGSPQRIEAMCARAAAGLPLYHPGDAGVTGPRLCPSELRQRLTGARQATPGVADVSDESGVMAAWRDVLGRQPPALGRSVAQLQSRLAAVRGELRSMARHNLDLRGQLARLQGAGRRAARAARQVAARLAATSKELSDCKAAALRVAAALVAG